MEFYLFLVILLFLLAATDLIVGVSNDAVNFLVSAVGSKVAPLRVIMIVASVGVFVGATFSSGMMEVARKGIFNPEMFVFSELMIVFLAVMLTDIILLDVFNTLGLPTSTTVSIVFELLGSSVVMAILKMNANGESLSLLSTYINGSKATQIIIGIFLSIVFAFALGAFLQYVSRLLFSFQFEHRLRKVGGIWAGFSFTALTYFLLIKGVAGASFISANQLNWISSNSLIILGSSFIFWSVLLSVLAARGVKILQFLVLFGTFSLAMAFAGNDLVNFVGVPIAGYESFRFWMDSGMAANQFGMEALAAPVRTPTIFLLAAGLIMVITLWFSKKARSVTATTVNLSRQEEGVERFQSSSLSRAIVSVSTYVQKHIGFLFPSIQEPPALSVKKVESPAAFDVIRASVNLTMASILIAFGTSLKLPLSTTYVSFMVAMGTSLADKAWDRDSAVYRITGVLNVIGGWFMTAIIAFSVAGLFAYLMHSFGLVAIILILALAVGLIIHGLNFHRKQETKRRTEEEADSVTDEKSDNLSSIGPQFSKLLDEEAHLIADALTGLVNEDQKLLRELRERLGGLRGKSKPFRNSMIRALSKLRNAGNGEPMKYVRLLGLEQDLMQSTELIVEDTSSHVINLHKPLKEEQIERVQELRSALMEWLQVQVIVLKEEGFLEVERKSVLLTALEQKLDKMLQLQMKGIREKSYSKRNSRLVMGLLIEIKDHIEKVVALESLLHEVRKP